MNDDFLIEKNKLKTIVKDYEEVIEDTKLEYENIYSLYKNDIETAQKKKNQITKRIELLEKNINSPYFARIDFENNLDNELNVCYIGKVGVSNYDNDIITVDWRSPIATLYYDSNIGEASFLVDDKTVNGQLKLKRQYTIKDKELINYMDVDSVSNDDLLKDYLGVNADKRLKNIVSTIQKEQNDIIRSSINTNLIIQGVAGSGKTTVALHRIAYLSYTYNKFYDSSSYMVIGPNKFFVNYISSVLPDLDVNDIVEWDLQGFLEYFTNQKFIINKDLKKDYDSLVCSLDFISIIDEYFKSIMNNVFNSYELKINDFVLLNNNEFKRINKDVLIDKYDTISDLIDRFIFITNEHINKNLDTYLVKLNNFMDNQLNQNNINDIRKERDFIRSKIKSELLTTIKTSFNKYFLNPVNVYKEILKTKIDNYSFVDISPIMYINYKIYSNKEYLNYKHVVIDEAQDYNEFTFYTLKTILKNATFSIYGDLAQNLYIYRSINSWDNIKDIMDSEIVYLNKSYRTSIEIMNEANKINKFLNLPLANAVIRHTTPVKYINSINLEMLLNNLIELNNNLSYNSIGIITKNKSDALDIYNYLNKKEIDVSLINEENIEDTNKISILTSDLSKGLEFDAVIIFNVSEENFNSNNILDNKLLYVSMTRALHELIILYEKDLTKSLID